MPLSIPNPLDNCEVCGGDSTYLVLVWNKDRGELMWVCVECAGQA